MIEIYSQTWKTIKAEQEAKLAELQRQLESQRHDYPDTQFIRGRIRSIRDLLDNPDRQSA